MQESVLVRILHFCGSGLGFGGAGFFGLVFAAVY